MVLLMTEATHAYADQFARLLELAGVAIIIGGVIIASFLFARSGLMTGDWRPAYVQYRSNLGRGILLGLELLVGADIISTITAPLTAESVGLLGGIVVIRTFLSFSLETEIEGCWPWRLAANDALPGGTDRR
jgi:uncharacterized membrane protein